MSDATLADMLDGLPTPAQQWFIDFRRAAPEAGALALRMRAGRADDGEIARYLRLAAEHERRAGACPASVGDLYAMSDAELVAVATGGE